MRTSLYERLAEPTGSSIPGRTMRTATLESADEGHLVHEQVLAGTGCALYTPLSTKGCAEGSARTQGTKAVETVDVDRHGLWIAPHA